MVGLLVRLEEVPTREPEMRELLAEWRVEDATGLRWAGGVAGDEAPCLPGLFVPKLGRGLGRGADPPMGLK